MLVDLGDLLNFSPYQETIFFGEKQWKKQIRREKDKYQVRMAEVGYKTELSFQWYTFQMVDLSFTCTTCW